MSSRRLLVVNPGTDASLALAIERAILPLRRPGELEIVQSTLDGAPAAVRSDEDIRVVRPMVVRQISANHADYDAFVIACYSDPGLAEARTVAKKPVFGIAESAAGLSASYGRRFGVLALDRDSIQRDIAYVRALGLQDFHAGERPLGVSPAVDEPDLLRRIIETGRELIEEDGAETVILGSAGLGAYRQSAQEALGIPVIDPVHAAVTMALKNFGLD